MLRRSTLKSLLVAVVVIAAALFAERWLPALTGALHIADGDSFELGVTRIRLEGIDAPELNQQCGTPEALWPCGRHARAALEQAAKAGEVSCRAVDTDRYGRSVSVCEADSKDLARLMVEQGLAVSTGLAYANAEIAARKARRGLWAGPFEMPADYRARHP